MTRQASRGLSIAPLLLAVVGLELSVASSEAGALVDPAMLVTKADVEAVLGAAVKDPKVTTNPMGQKTVFYSPAAEGTKVRYVQISLNQTAAMPERMTKNGMSAPRLFADTAKMLSDLKEVPGLGDKAFWGGSGLKPGAGLHVLKGHAYFAVDVALGNEQACRQAAEKLARQALSRM